MVTLSRTLILNALIKHETLTLEDLLLEKNLGLVPDRELLAQLLTELEGDAYIEQLNDVVPRTYTITAAGIAEGKRQSGLSLLFPEADLKQQLN